AGGVWDGGRGLGAGRAVGAAREVKLIPAPMVLVLALQARDRRALGRFAGGLALAALPFVPVLLAVPRAFFRNAIAYKSLANPWGLVGFLDAARATPRFERWASVLWALYRAQGRHLVLLAPVAAAIVGRRRGWTAQRLGAITLMLFLVLAPGWSVHYLVYPLPLLFACDLRLGALYSTVAGACALSAYLAFWTGTVPWYSDFSLTSPPLTVMLGVCAWALLAAALR